MVQSLGAGLAAAAAGAAGAAPSFFFGSPEKRRFMLCIMACRGVRETREGEECKWQMSVGYCWVWGSTSVSQCSVMRSRNKTRRGTQNLRKIVGQMVASCLHGDDAYRIWRDRRKAGSGERGVWSPVETMAQKRGSELGSGKTGRLPAESSRRTRKPARTHSSGKTWCVCPPRPRPPARPPALP